MVPGRIIRPSTGRTHLHTTACKKCAKEVDVRMSDHRCIVWSFIIAYGGKDTNVCCKHEICVVMCSRRWVMRHEIMLRCCVAALCCEFIPMVCVISSQNWSGISKFIDGVASQFALKIEYLVLMT
jgi:hypothetical protein